jgi:copper chaperone CopZ
MSIMKKMKKMKKMLLALSLLLSLACQRAEPSHPVTATYKVGGMSCDACASNIQTSVGAIEGVVSAEVSYKDGKAEVTYDPGKVKPEAIEAAVQRMGYTARRQGS